MMRILMDHPRGIFHYVATSLVVTDDWRQTSWTWADRPHPGEGLSKCRADVLLSCVNDRWPNWRNVVTIEVER